MFRQTQSGKPIDSSLLSEGSVAIDSWCKSLVARGKLLIDSWKKPSLMLRNLFKPSLRNAAEVTPDMPSRWRKQKRESMNVRVITNNTALGRIFTGLERKCLSLLRTSAFEIVPFVIFTHWFAFFGSLWATPHNWKAFLFDVTIFEQGYWLLSFN